MATTIDAGIYASGALYAKGQPLMDALRASGMTTIVAWSLHVHPNGDLVLNDDLIVSGGSYAGRPDWPAQIATLKQAPTSVETLLFSVGAGGVEDFHNVQALIQEHGTGPDSILHRNFAALEETFPGTDAIDFDDEDLMDAQTTVAFAQMLAEIGFDVTFCPYYDAGYWAGCLKTLNGSGSQVVTRFNLQCYAGGSGNDPGEWVEAIDSAGFDGASMVSPGLWCRNEHPDGAPGWCPDDVYETFSGWRSTGIQGGWIWLLDDVLEYESSGLCSTPMDVLAYSKAIRAGLGG